MRGVRIPQDLNGEDQFILGLSVTRLAALLLGLLAAYTLLHLDLPDPLRFGAACIAALAGAAITWIRPEGRSLVHWGVAAIEFAVTQRFASEHHPRVKAGADETRQAEMRAEAPRFTVLSQSTTDGSRESASHGTMPDDDVIDLPNAAVDVMDLPNAAVDVIELPDAAVDILPTARQCDDDAHRRPAPVYLGGPQIITFFATKGGTGRTTLATEVATLLARKGRYRESPVAQPASLRVALIDFDLGSANVSARLGVAQPTMLDYLCNVGLQTPDPLESVLHHGPTGLDVLLGPSKCLSGDRAELCGVAQAAHILSAFKSAGYHYLVLDMGASLGDLETYLLETANRIYCVVTPTAGSVQSLYRGVEALRRLGLGSKLQYVANKMRDGLNLNEPMSDLGGSLVASIPYDAGFESAENHHQPLVIQSGGPTLAALSRLAASIYPALDVAERNRSLAPFSWFSRRRRAG
jgi:MinD-like ATPase involved in chromosome partitioning or flagellar assembly